MKPTHTLFAAINRDGEFSLQGIFRKKCDVSISPTDAKHGTFAGKIGMNLFEGDPISVVVDSALATKHIGWIVKNPDETFWWESLSETESDAWGNATRPDRIARMQSLGFKAVAVVFEPIK